MTRYSYSEAYKKYTITVETKNELLFYLLKSATEFHVEREKKNKAKKEFISRFVEFMEGMDK